MHVLLLIVINLGTKFEVAIFICSKDMLGPKI